MSHYSLLVVFVLTICVGQLWAAPIDPVEEWAAYKLKFGKHYANQDEDDLRFTIFTRSLVAIEEHNMKNSSYEMGLNEMSDWTAKEISRLFGALQPRNKIGSGHSVESILTRLNLNESLEALPERVDWRQVPQRVGPVKHQGRCGSCWSFSTTGLLEGQQVVKGISKQVIPLSEQQLLDCVNDGVNCDTGGSMSTALESIQKIGGIQSASEYPYTGQTGICGFHLHKPIMKVDDFFEIIDEPEDVARLFVSSYGPVAIGADICPTQWMQYKSGILKPDDWCQVDAEGETYNGHALLIVGYDSDPSTGEKYWILKNSWGADWGESGYVRVARGPHVHKRFDAHLVAASVV